MVDEGGRFLIWHILHPLSRSREYLLRVEGQDKEVSIILAGYLVFLWKALHRLSSENFMSIQRLQSSPRVKSNLHVDQTLPATTNTKSAMYLIRKTLWYSNKNSSFIFIRFKIVCWNSENGNERSNCAYAFLYKRVLTYSLARWTAKGRRLTRCL